MGPESDRLERLASSVADGIGVDWEAAARDARDEDERRLVENLRRLQQLGAASRGRATPPAVWRGLRLRGPLGHGAFGEVFAAWDPNLQREVALKLARVGSDASSAPALEEGRLLARVLHPHVVAVYGAGVSEGWAGLWMERVQGRTLAAIVNEKGPLGHWDLGLVALDVSRALAAVHAARILHCDIKPSNVMREDGGRTVLMDFGIGRRAGAPGAPRAGTPAFMAPETLRGEPATVQSDVYMVGALLFALAAGAPPGEDTSGSLGEVRSDLPAPFVAAVERALDPNPGRRFSSADDMAAAFREALDVPAHGRRLRWQMGLVAAVAVAGLTGLWATGWSPPSSRAVPRGGRGAPVPPASGPPPAPSSAEPAAETAARSGVTDPFVPPVASTAPLSDGLDPGPSAARPFSIQAARRLGETPEVELRASRPLSVYVVREEQPSRCFLLFPLPGARPSNPLSGRTSHRLRLPSAGGPPAGRLLLIASPWPLGDFEAAVGRSRVPRGEMDVSGIPLTEESVAALRVLEPPGAGTGPERALFESAPPLEPHLQMVQGPWVRVLGVR